jgi:hypothetical protein
MLENGKAPNPATTPLSLATVSGKEVTFHGGTSVR